MTTTSANEPRTSPTGSLPNRSARAPGELARLLTNLATHPAGDAQEIVSCFLRETSLVCAYSVSISGAGEPGMSRLAPTESQSRANDKRSGQTDDVDLEKAVFQTGFQTCMSGRPAVDTTALNHQGADLSRRTTIVSVPAAGQSGVAVVGVFTAQQVLKSTDCLATMALFAKSLAGASAISQLHAQSQLVHHTAAISELVAQVESAGSFDEACRVLVDTLFAQLPSGSKAADSPSTNADESVDQEIHVYLAVNDDSKGLMLKARSGYSGKLIDSEHHRLAESATRECLSRRIQTSLPPVDGIHHQLLCHQQFADEAKCPNIETVCLLDGENNIQGVVMVTSPTPFAESVRPLLAAASEPLGSSLRVWKKSRKNKIHEAIDTVGSLWRHQRRNTVLAVLGVILLAMAIPVPHRPNTECEVVPSTRNIVAAPVEGRLMKCLVKPGETVRKNQVIAKLDQRELTLELQEVNAELYQAVRVRDGHVDRLEAGDSRVASLEIERLTARADLLRHQLDQMEIKSPIDGVVISGDLKKLEGAQFEYGQSLFEIAPLDRFDIELSVSEDDVRYVNPEMEASIRLDAFPFEKWNGKIDSIHPSAELRDANNVFVAQVSLATDQVDLKPGMRGTAKIEADWAPLGWTLFRKPLARAGRWLGW